MRKKHLIIMAIFGIAAMFFATGIYAGTAVDDMIKMENEAYAKHKKGIVMFSHKKHSEEYKAGCGECHHDADNKPLDNLKIGDDVQNCIECHTKASRPPRAKKDAPKLSTKEKMAYHAYAIHVNCKECHPKAKK
jgi:hypothetical protein